MTTLTKDLVNSLVPPNVIDLSFDATIMLTEEDREKLINAAKLYFIGIDADVLAVHVYTNIDLLNESLKDSMNQSMLDSGVAIVATDVLTTSTLVTTASAESYQQFLNVNNIPYTIINYSDLI